MRSLNGFIASFKSLTLPSFLILSAITVFATGILFLLGMLELKWQVFLFFAYAAGLIFLAIPDKRLLTLGILFFLMPVNLNFQPIYELPVVFRPISGLVIGIRDLPFFLLVVFRLIDFHLGKEKITAVHAVTALFSAAVLWISISMLLSDLEKSIAVFQLVQMLKCLAILIVLPHFLQTRKAILLLVAVLMVSVGIQAVIGGLQFFSGSTLGLGIFGEGEQGFRQMRAGAGFVNRVGGTIGSNNKLAVFLGMLLPIGIGTLFTRTNLKYRLFCVLPFIFAGAGLDILTFSRGGWISLFIGSLIVIYGSIYKLTRRIVLPFIASFLVVTLLAVSAITFSESVRMRLFGNDYGSAYTRVPQAMVALRMIQDDPLFGKGLGNFVPSAFKFDNTRLAITYRFPMPMHNEMLLIASESGLPALFLFLTIFTILLFNLLKVTFHSKDPILPFIALGLVGSFVTWFLQNIIEFTFVFMSINFWSLAALALAIIKAHKDEKEVGAERQNSEH